MKREVRASTDLIPTPVVLVTTQAQGKHPNIITLAWVGVVNSEPPMVGIGVRSERYSYAALKETGEFCVNIPHEEIIRAVDVCGVVSGKTEDKFALTGLTPEKASKVTPPLIRECPINLECRVAQTLELGSHTLFIGEILTVHWDEAILNEKGKIDLSKFKPIAYCPGIHNYHALGEKIGKYGFTKGKMS